MRSPLSVIPFTVRESLSFIFIETPIFPFLPGFISTSQVVISYRFKSSTSTRPPCSVSAYIRAGMTLVLLTTRTSPAFTYSLISRKILSSIFFVFLSVNSTRRGGIPRLRGRLGDQFVGQFVIKIALSILCLFFHNHKSLPFGIPSSFPAVFRYDSPRRVHLLLFLRDFIRPDRRGKTAFPPFC